MSEEYRIAENVYIDYEERNLRNDFALTSALTCLADFCNRQPEPETYANAIVDGWARKIIAGREAAKAAVDKIAWPDDPAAARHPEDIPEIAITEEQFREVAVRTTEDMRASLLNVMATLRRLENE